ncbi:hypothetical protein AX17_006096 [Amanita inopinata Kibby_2008]|nr:hypothetical protein AX17_006096 [Amanita inopinata Kibby_2008]
MRICLSTYHAHANSYKLLWNEEEKCSSTASWASLEAQPLLLHTVSCFYSQRDTSACLGVSLINVVMKTKHMDAASAVQFIKSQRPQAHPNYGFITQLAAFAACQYDPCPSNPTYRMWKRKQKRVIATYLNYMADTTVVIPEKLLLSSGFPEDPEQAEALIHDMDITHMLSISPVKMPAAVSMSTFMSKYHRIEISNQNKEDLLLALPEACAFIREAINGGGSVLVHSLVESRACTVVCASLMHMKGMSTRDASAVLEDALPLFNPTRNFSRHLELFAACGHGPTQDHTLVRDWIRSEETYSMAYTFSSLSSSTTSSPMSSSMSSPAPSTPPSSISSRTSSASSPRGARSLVKMEGGEKDSLTARAVELLSETGFDLGAFGEALAAIQESAARQREIF